MSYSRKKSYLLNISSSFFASVLSILAGLIMVPAALGYWHEETYGVWILITTFISYLSLSSLGLNSAATILISKTLSIKSKLSILKRALVIMFWYVIVILCVIALISVFVSDWGFLLGKASENVRTQAYDSCTIMLFFFVFNLSFSLLSSALIGFQKAHIDNIFQATIPIANLFALLAVIGLKGDLVSFAIYSGIAGTLVNFIKLFTFLMLSRKWRHQEQPSVIPADSIEGYWEIIAIGFRFLLMGVAVLAWWNSDNIVISQYLGMEEVTRYSITFKLFVIAYTLMNIIGSSLSPIFAKEFALGNWEWINKTYLLSTRLAAFVGGGVCIGGILLSNEIITLWTGASGYAGLAVVTTLGIYTYFLSVNNIDAGVINTCNYTKGIAWVYLFSSTVKLFVSVIFVKLIGIVGVAIGTLAASALFTSWLFPFWINKHSNGMIKTRTFETFKNFLYLLPFIVVSVLVSVFIQNGTVEKYIFSIAILIMYCLVYFFIYLKEALSYGKTALKLNQFFNNFFSKVDG